MMMNAMTVTIIMRAPIAARAEPLNSIMRVILVAAPSIGISMRKFAVPSFSGSAGGSSISWRVIPGAEGEVRAGRWTIRVLTD